MATIEEVAAILLEKTQAGEIQWEVDARGHGYNNSNVIAYRVKHAEMTYKLKMGDKILRMIVNGRDVPLGTCADVEEMHKLAWSTGVSQDVALQMALDSLKGEGE